jgi:hypothetical protein
VVKKVLSGGALMLSRMDGEDLVKPMNADSIKKYYASQSVKESSAMNSLCKEPVFFIKRMIS